MPESGQVEILMVEDNPCDVRLTVEAFKETGIPGNISVAADGEEAIEFLSRSGKFPDAVRPDLILLDLNLPKKNGREVLKEIKSDPGLRRIPVVVFTSSENEDDILQAYDLHVNAYIKKPMEFDQYARVMETLEDFWFSVVKLPVK